MFFLMTGYGSALLGYKAFLPCPICYHKNLEQIKREWGCGTIVGDVVAMVASTTSVRASTALARVPSEQPLAAKLAAMGRVQ